MPRKSAATLAAEKAAAEALAAEQATTDTTDAADAAAVSDETEAVDAPQDAPADPAVTSAADALGVIDTATAGLPPADAATTASQGGPDPEPQAPEAPRAQGDHTGEFVRVGAECISFSDGTEWAIDPDTGIVGKRLA